MKYENKNILFDKLLENKDVVLPDYDHSILQTITSVLKYYGVDTPYKSNELLDKKLSEGYQNVVLLILDGMGKNILEEHSRGYFKNNTIDYVTSVFPSTTTAALTTYYSGLPPISTGWIAWSQYFKEYGRYLDVFSHQDSYTKQNYNVLKDAYEKIKYKDVFNRIEEVNKDVLVHDISHRYAEKRTSRTYKTESIEEIAMMIETICSNKKNNFLMCYYDNPDSTMHRLGTSAEEVKDIIRRCEDSIEDVINKIDSKTLIIISADHGHLNVGEEFEINEYEDLKDCMLMPPAFESRCITFFIKPNCKEEFKKLFINYFEDEYLLLTKEEFLSNNFLGYGEVNKKIDDFVGDYVAISFKGASIKISNDLFPGKVKKASTHCGLSKEEMIVPVITINN